MKFRMTTWIERISGRARILLLMALGIAIVMVAGIWDAQRQDEFAFDELIREHHLLALTLATRFSQASAHWGPVDRENLVSELLAAARALSAEGQVVVMLQTPARPGFLLSDGRVFAGEDIERAVRMGQPGVTLDRSVAARLGLKPRSAVAGVAGFEWPDGGSAAVAVIGSASAERDRRRHDQWRTILTTVLVSSLILGFGAVALRRQRRELELERRVAVHRTERERDAELARADRMAAIAAVSSGIAHEISTPLGIISGRLEQLGRADGGDLEQAKLLTSIAQQVDRISKVIRGLLGLARGDAPTLTRVSPSQLANEAIQLVKHRFATAGVRLRVVLSSLDDKLVACDPALFEQVLVNILINALEASEPGQTVELSVDGRASQVRFVVLDEGCGITQTAIAHATEPFFTTKARKGGSGLGLAIARQIVAHHRGELLLERRFDSGARNSGTRATVALPESA